MDQRCIYRRLGCVYRGWLHIQRVWTLIQFEHFFSPISRAHLTDLSPNKHNHRHHPPQQQLCQIILSTASAEMRCLRVLADGIHRFPESHTFVGVLGLSQGEGLITWRLQVSKIISLRNNGYLLTVPADEMLFRAQPAWEMLPSAF